MKSAYAREQAEALSESVERIRQMEQCFDVLQEAAGKNEDASFRDKLQLLKQYYEGGQWLGDYELEEKGLLPPELKRGVLAQDAVYDFLEQIRG